MLNVICHRVRVVVVELRLRIAHVLHGYILGVVFGRKCCLEELCLGFLHRFLLELHRFLG